MDRNKQTSATSKLTATTKRCRSRWFYTSMGIVATFVVIAGFGNSYYGMVFGTGSLSTLVKIHGLVFAAWLMLFITQTSLIMARRVALHRQLGLASAVLAVLMGVLGYATAISGLL